MHHSFPAHQGFQRTSKGGHLSRVSAAAIKHDSSPLLQIQTHSLCAFRGRESGFDTHHPTILTLFFLASFAHCSAKLLLSYLASSHTLTDLRLSTGILSHGIGFLGPKV